MDRVQPSGRVESFANFVGIAFRNRDERDRAIPKVRIGFGRTEKPARANLT